MAIAFDNNLDTLVSSSVTSVTRSFTVTGSDPCVVTGALTTIAADMSSITYNGVALTKVGESNLDAFSTETHFLVNASTGTNDLVFNSGSTATFVTNATSYTGVRTDAHTPASSGTTGGASSTISHSLTTVFTGSWIVATTRTGGSYPNATGTNYVREAYNTSNGVHLGSSEATVSPGSNSVSVGISASSTWGVFLFELQASGAAADVGWRNLLTQGVG